MKVVIYPKKPIAKKQLGYLVSSIYLAIVVLIISYIFLWNHFILCIVAGLSCINIFFSKKYSWFERAELEEKQGKLIFTYWDIVDTFGNNKSVYTIGRVSGIKERKGGSLVIKGDITVKEPLLKAKSVKKVVINEVTDEFMSLLLSFQERNA